MKMKSSLKSVLFVLLPSLWLITACEDFPISNAIPESNTLEESVNIHQMSAVQTQICGEEVYSLTAGFHINIGNLIVSNSETHLYVTYNTSDNWRLEETHVHVGNSLDDIPTNAAGNPVIGQFDYNSLHEPLVNTFTYIIPFDELELDDSTDDLIVVAHATVVQVDESEDIIVGSFETAWGGDTEGSRTGWWLYAEYTIEECVECEEVAESAWSDGYKYQSRGNWATYTVYDDVEKEVILFAGQNKNIGTVTFSAPANDEVTITIELNEHGGFLELFENVKIQDYETAPTGSPAPGLFEYKGNATGSFFSIKVPENNFYGVHVDALVIKCDTTD